MIGADATKINVFHPDYYDELEVFLKTVKHGTMVKYCRRSSGFAAVFFGPADQRMRGAASAPLPGTSFANQSGSGYGAPGSALAQSHHEGAMAMDKGEIDISRPWAEFAVAASTESRRIYQPAVFMEIGDGRESFFSETIGGFTAGEFRRVRC